MGDEGGEDLLFGCVGMEEGEAAGADEFADGEDGSGEEAEESDCDGDVHEELELAVGAGAGQGAADGEHEAEPARDEGGCVLAAGELVEDDAEEDQQGAGVEGDAGHGGLSARRLGCAGTAGGDEAADTEDDVDEGDEGDGDALLKAAGVDGHGGAFGEGDDGADARGEEADEA